ncbi:MAG: hypothetical protein K9K38_03050 [Rhodoferax sp.]|nr:hypothetical protein [Rhodoferax sp.]
MPSALSISLAGMQAAQTALNVSGQRIANAATQGLRQPDPVASEPARARATGVVAAADNPVTPLTQDVVSQLQAKNTFLANLAVFKAADQMAGALLKAKA